LKKICIVIGSRANYSSIKSVLSNIKKNKNLRLQLVLNTSSLLYKYGNVSKLIEEDGFKIDEKIYNLVEGEIPLTMAKSTGLALIELSSTFERLSPDIVLTVGDRFETMGTVLAACYMNIPLAHTMGGEISGTIDESIRHAVTKLAHIHFPANKNAAKVIEKLGEEKSRIFNVGCPRIDLVKEILNDKKIILTNNIFDTGVGDKLNLAQPFLVISQHPVTTEFKDAENQMKLTLDSIADIDIQAIVLWPNADAGSAYIAKAIRSFRENNSRRSIHFFRNLPVEIYIKLLEKTKCLIGNSSSGIREGNFIGVPCVNIGSRQNGRDRGSNVIDVQYDYEKIKSAVSKQIKIGKYKSGNLYGNGTAGKKITEILAGDLKINIQKTLRY